MEEETVETPHGPARVHLTTVDEPIGALVLGHGAGGGVTAPDLQAAAKVATGLGLVVALVEQPYRVAGRRSPAPAKQLDAAWHAVVEQLRAGPMKGLDIVTGGRSSGARVACRTAIGVGAVAVLCLAFPLRPPGRTKDGQPKPSRLEELDGAGVPTLVVQGERDTFGMPPEAPGRQVVVVDGDHSLKKDMARIRATIEAWLPTVVGRAG
ncbi:alpha/beta family hydrolase [Georgenia alba]|uniref:Alpha/beta family hydrolase n=1 Tax=Georgenia alba TaxID=2233858 RepID=A0ABW2Q703_9MICO